MLSFDGKTAQQSCTALSSFEAPIVQDRFIWQYNSQTLHPLSKTALYGGITARHCLSQTESAHPIVDEKYVSLLISFWRLTARQINSTGNSVRSD